MESVETSISKMYDITKKSKLDTKLYRGIELINGMKVILVSDPDTEKSSAAMGIQVGHMCDPIELPGLAHFCEHMLFLGTEKYPEENDYQKFIQEHGGFCNAYTSSDTTCYYFDITPNSLESALDRFAQFFISPLFTESATEREVNAVNSEFEKDLHDDSHRLLQLDKSTCNPEHDFSKFGTGSLETLSRTPKLKGINIREELLKFHQQMYSANLMALCVLGKESLEDLEKLVIPLFSKVENKNVSVPKWPDNPFDSAHLKLKGHVVPVKDINSLHLCFPIPDLRHEYSAGSSHYIAHLVGHEGQGSLLSELKRLGWVTALSTGEKSGANGFAFFGIDCGLTKGGLEHIDEIVTLVFQYLAMLKKCGPQEWVFEELKKLADISFHFKDKEKPHSYTSFLCTKAFEYPMEDVVTGFFLYDKLKPELVQQLMDHLTPNNMRIAVVGRKFENICDETEKWYGTKYRIDLLAEDLLKKWENVDLHLNLKLPLPNDLIAENFNIVPIEIQVSSHPVLIKNTKMGRLWFKQDDRFHVPKTSVVFHLESPMAIIDPLNHCMTQLYVMLVTDYLVEYTYSAKLAGFHDAFKLAKNGVLITVHGFSDKLHIFLQEIFEKLTHLQIEEKRFDIVKEELRRCLENFKAEQPHKQAAYYCSYLLADRFWTKDELLNCIDDFSFGSFQNFIHRLFSRIHIESLMHGNLNSKQALDLMNLVENVFLKSMNTKYVLPSQLAREREFQLLDGCHYVYELSNKVHKSSSVETYYQCGVQDTRSNALLELLVSIMSEPCYHFLRTQDQLGYIVFSGARRSHGVQGLRIIVQSEKATGFIDGRIETFIDFFDKYLQELTDDEFKNHIESLSAKLLEKPKKLSEESSRFWMEITIQQYNFDRNQMEALCLAEATKEDLYTFFKELIACDAPKRKKLSVHVIPESTTKLENDVDNLCIPEKEEHDIDLERTSIESFFIPPPPAFRPPVKIKSVAEFKSSLGLYPQVPPYIQIQCPFHSIEKAKL